MARQTFNGTKINVEFEESVSRQQLNSGENISTLFGKIKKIFSDLKSVCFSGSYKDLNDTPTTATADTDGLMSAEDKTKLDNADNKYALKSKYGDTTINVGRKAGTDVGDYSTAEGCNTTASGGNSHSEGLNTTASGAQSHAEGVETIASGSRSHAEGVWTIASGGSNHAEGKETTANGNNSCHAEGSKTTASGIATHAEGNSSNKVTDLITDFSWNGTTNDDIINAWNTQKFSVAHGRSSHVEGSDNLSLGHSSHSEGHNTVAIGDQSHTSGYFTKALHDNEAAYGKYNESNDNTLFSIGDGTADDARHNAFEITTDGGKLHDKDIATTNNISNPNLLINPDFKINQRESTEYSPARYTADRWFNDTYTKVTVESDGITITAVQDINQEWWGVRQYIEPVGQQYSNLPITVSAYISEFTGEWFIPAPTNSGNNRINITASGLNSITFTGNYNRWFGIGAVNVKAGDYIKLKWMKVEVGSVATQFVTSDSTLELMKCQRYYTTGEYAFDKTTKNVNYAIVNVQFPVKMRTKPTVTIYSMIGTVNTISEWVSHIDAIESVYANGDDLDTSGFTSITSVNSFVENAAYKFKYTADAEIY